MERRRSDARVSRPRLCIYRPASCSSLAAQFSSGLWTAFKRSGFSEPEEPLLASRSVDKEEPFLRLLVCFWAGFSGGNRHVVGEECRRTARGERETMRRMLRGNDELTVARRRHDSFALHWQAPFIGLAICRNRSRQSCTRRGSKMSAGVLPIRATVKGRIRWTCNDA